MPPAAARPILWISVAALVLYAVVRFDGWSWFRDAWDSMRSQEYSERRIDVNFAGVPIDRARAELEARLAPQDSVALSPKIRADENARQRFIEGLYPRRIVAGAAPVVDAVAAGEAKARGLAILATTKSGYAITLEGGPDAAAPRDPAPPDPVLDQGTIHWFSALAGLLGILGLGRALLRFKPGSDDWVAGERLAACVVAGTIAAAAAASIATWSQIRFFGPWIVGMGIAAGGASMLVRSRRSGTRPASPPWTRETWGFALALALFAWVCIGSPISGWDGRSIWLIRAKQLTAHGMLAKTEFTSEEMAFSHPEYPLGFPAFMAQLTSLGGAFSERTAALAIPILTTALFSLLWQCSRARLGRAAGGSFTLAVFLSVAPLIRDGYADGYLVACLAIGFLALGSPTRSALAWLVLGCAAILKQEAIPFGAAIVIAGALTRRRADASLGFRWPVLVFAPAAGHWIWRSIVGLRGDFAGPVSDWWDRLATVVSVGSRSIWTFPLTTEGSAAIVGFAILCFLRRGEPRASGAARAMALTAVFVVMIVGIVSLTSRPVEWLARTSLDRLILHPAALALLGGLLLLRSAEEVPAPAAASPTAARS
jgi:hypothetical protein